MPPAKPLRILTDTPNDHRAAVEEWTTDVVQFIELANRARLGHARRSAIELDRALTAFSEGDFTTRFSGLARWAVMAGLNIQHHVRESHWHLRLCRSCQRWLLTKDQRRIRCGRPACRRIVKKLDKRSQRAAQAKVRRNRGDSR